MSGNVNYCLINHEFQLLEEGAIFELNIENSSPQIKTHYAQDVLLNRLRQEYQWQALDSPKPLKLFNLASYDLLVEFGELTDEIKPVITFLDKHSVPMPPFWAKSMYLVVMVKGTGVIDFAKCKDPRLNPHPSALRRPPGATSTFTFMDLELNKIREYQDSEDVEKWLVADMFQKQQLCEEVMAKLSDPKFLGSRASQEFNSDPILPSDHPESEHILLTLKKDRRKDMYSKLGMKEMTVGGRFVYEFAENHIDCKDLDVVSSTLPWPASKCLSVILGNEFTTYSPRNDLGIWTPEYPLWLGETCSEDDCPVGEESDFYRLLFQGAGLVSYFNWLKFGIGEITGTGYVIPLVYIDKLFRARIYVMRQVGDQFRFTLVETAQLGETLGAARFLKFLYNTIEKQRIDANPTVLRFGWRIMMGMRKEEPKMTSKTKKTHSKSFPSYPSLRSSSSQSPTRSSKLRRPATGQRGKAKAAAPVTELDAAPYEVSLLHLPERQNNPPAGSPKDTSTAYSMDLDEEPLDSALDERFADATGISLLPKGYAPNPGTSSSVASSSIASAAMRKNAFPPLFPRSSQGTSTSGTYFSLGDKINLGDKGTKRRRSPSV